MDRPIKFRAWDGKRMFEVQKMLWAMDGDIFAYESGSDKLQTIPIMQFTGLTDRNGKEIYEGDIVRGPSNTAVVLESTAKSNRQVMANFEVKWSPNQFWGSWVLRPLTRVHRTYPAFSNCEVIGNIYENKDLLNESQ